MTGKRKALFIAAPLVPVLALALCVVFGPRSASAKVVYLSDGALLNSSGQWDLPKQGSCPADLTKTTRPDCVALRFPTYTTAPSCATGTGGNPAVRAWATTACNDLDPAHQSQSTCQAVPGRIWSAGSPGVCAVSMKDESRNIATCVGLGGTWQVWAAPAGTCVGSWVMPPRNDAAYQPALLNGSAPPAAIGPGDQCLRCHNEATQYNSTDIRWVGEDYLKMGHKNMARKVNYCSKPGYTNATDCGNNGGTWIKGPQDGPDGLPYTTDDSGNPFDWTATPNSTINILSGSNAGVHDLYWVFGDWLSPLPRAIYNTPPVNGKPGVSYSCARCHTTGWTSDGTLQLTKEPERSFPGITWDGTSVPLAKQVNLASGVTDDSNKMASWDQFGIQCSRCHISVVDDALGSCSLSQANCNALQAVCEGTVDANPAPQGCGGVYSGGVCTQITAPVKITTDSTTCAGLGGTFTAPTGSDPTKAGYSAPLGMGTHNGGNTGADAGSGYCSNSRYTKEYQCTSNGYQWLTACSVNPTNPVCVLGTAGYCSNSLATDPPTCGAGGGSWHVNDATDCSGHGGFWNPGGWCSNTSYTTEGDCTTNGFAWIGGWCSFVATSANCATNNAWCSDGVSADKTTCQGANKVWMTGTWSINGTQASCQLNPGGSAGTWSGFSSCSIPAICSKPIPGKTNATATKADCDGVSGTWQTLTSEYTCIAAGAHYTGSKPQRGQIITSLCMECHRQETGGLPIDANDPAGIWVGPYHNSVGLISHPHGPMFLNSPHGKYSGTFAQIPTARFGVSTTPGYSSHFAYESEALNTGAGCTNCHNPHRSTVGEANPNGDAVKECQECHAGPYEKDLKKINHLAGKGTPLENMLTDPAEACETCHMPEGMHMFRINPDKDYSTFPPLALTTNTKANTAPDGTYTKAVWVDVDHACGQCHGGGTAHAETMGTINVYTTQGTCEGAGGTWATTSYSTTSKTCSTNNKLVVASTADLAPGQRISIAGAGTVPALPAGDFETYIVSISGNTLTLAGAASRTVTDAEVIQNPTTELAKYRPKHLLAEAAKGMHAGSGTTYPTTFGTAVSGLKVNTYASVTCNGTCTFTYDWDWGDDTAHGSGASASHTYATAGSKTITLKVKEGGLEAGMATRNVMLYAPVVMPVPGGLGGAGCGGLTIDTLKWTATFTDSSTPAGALVVVDWGDNSVDNLPAGSTFSHTYRTPSSFLIVQKVVDATPNAVVAPPCTVNLAAFTISGTVKTAAVVGPPAKASVGLGAAVVTLRSATTGAIARSVYTAADGSYSVGSLKPDTYWVSASKRGYVFPAPLSVSVGDNKSGQNITATSNP